MITETTRYWLRKLLYCNKEKEGTEGCCDVMASDKSPHIREFHSHEMSRRGFSRDTECRLVAARVGETGTRLTASGHEISFRGNKNVLELDSGND